MSVTQSNLTCIGTGLVALDVVISNDMQIPAHFLAGGSCGNVLTILSYFGWQSYPIARLSDNGASSLLLEDLKQWLVNSDFMTFTADGSTPIIIHRILKDKQGLSKHRFEFKNPEDGKYLPSYKPCLSKSVKDIVTNSPTPQVFYFDRINRASIDLAKEYKAKGTVIFFEPSSIKDEKGFKECLEVSDIIKFSEDRIPNYNETFLKGQALLEIQTMGDKGLRYRRKNDIKWTELKGFHIDNVIDTAGAGDWCTAGIISTIFSMSTKNPEELLTDEILTKAFKFGQVLSALNCTYEGARGLMYSIKYKELRLKVENILSANSNFIHQIKPSIVKLKEFKEIVKIASLLN